MAKALSLKLDESTYSKAEKIRKRLKLPRNTYIRKAISHYNSLYARKLLEREYSKASQRLGAAHLDYLKETELLEGCSRANRRFKPLSPINDHLPSHDKNCWF